GKPVEVPFEVKNDVGLSAICFTCHNSRVNATDFEAGKTTSNPHYSAAAEMLSGMGGITYGQTLPNSTEHLKIGVAPIKNEAYDGKNLSVPPFLFSKALDAKGNIPGPCVTCHMWAPVTSPITDTFAFKAGGHSFNTVTPDGKDYGASCKTCHGDVKDYSVINLTNKDTDGNGKAEGAQVEVKGLLNILWKALEAKGAKQTGNNPYATLPVGADGKVDPKVSSAWFNFRLVYGVMWHTGTDGKIVPGNEGAASAAHNYKRSVALLQLALKDLTGNLPAGMVDGTK
ncbi:MAG: hypothetical protein HY327_11845, partial [Chloroflexi bacterium]|nr:hypothetical protein [Chloroflexota bacterium]